MNVVNVTCKDCGSILAQLKTPVMEQRYTSTSMCQSCAAKQLARRKGSVVSERILNVRTEA